MSLLPFILVPLAFSVELFEGQAWYIGEPHEHTGISGDGRSLDLSGACGSVPCGNFAEVFDYAREMGLDWLALSDHANGAGDGPMDPADWDLYWTSLLGHDDTSGLLVVPGVELWFAIEGVDYGHKNLYLFGSDEALASVTLPDVQPTGSMDMDVGSCDAIATFMAGLEARYGHSLLIPHHPMMTSPLGTKWDCHVPEYEVAVEVYSAWGNHLGGDWTWDPAVGGVDPLHSVQSALDPSLYGYQMGFLGGTDAHNTLPGNLCIKPTETAPCTGGLSIVVLPEEEPFTREAVYQAMVERRTLATSGPNVPVHVEFTLGETVLATLGQPVSLPAGQDLGVAVRVPDDVAPAVASVRLVTPAGSSEMVPRGDLGWVVRIPAVQVPEWAYVAVELDGILVYGPDACDDGGSDDQEWIWASPSWITVEGGGEGDLDGDGFTTAEGDCDDGDPAIHPGADDPWYDEVDSDCLGNDDFDADADGTRFPMDCDDQDPSVHPGVEETWYDGVDSDCDGADDMDADGDGAPRDSDCDDADPAVQAACDSATDTGTGPQDTGTPPKRRGCGGCAGTSRPPSGEALLALALLGTLLRRRSRVQRP